MNLIMLSTDRKIFEKGSAVRERIVDYGTLFDELHVFVFSKRSLKFMPEHIAPNVWLYPSNSWFSFLYPVSVYRKARVLIKKRHFDKTHTVITAQDPFEVGITALLIAWRSKLPLHVQVHTDFLNPEFIGLSVFNQIRLTLAAFVLPKAQRIRVVSEKIKKGIILSMQIEKEKITVLPIFVDTKAIMDFVPRIDLKKQYPQFKFTIVMPTRLSKEKDIPFAFNMFRAVLNRYPFTGLIILGQGPLLQELQAQAKALSMENSVVFVPWQKDVISYLKTANLFLLTSRFEGYGLSLVEAALSGTPIVTTPVGIAEELTNGLEALVCPIGDTKCFIQSIFSMIEDNERRERMRLHAKMHFEKNVQTKRKYLAQFKQGLDLWSPQKSL